jgi:hypothetical protein
MFAVNVGNRDLGYVGLWGLGNNLLLHFLSLAVVFFQKNKYVDPTGSLFHLLILLINSCCRNEMITKKTANVYKGCIVTDRQTDI